MSGVYSLEVFNASVSLSMSAGVCRCLCMLTFSRMMQLKLSQKIQWHEEEYDRAVKEVSLRRAPTQNGSDRRRYLAFAQGEATSELALRPPDRQVCIGVCTHTHTHTHTQVSLAQPLEPTVPTRITATPNPESRIPIPKPCNLNP